ncbi:CAS/CSE chromosome segregation protein [Encephalitozoon intestinalis ATCC 50506]|uniref:CAS/CSE chromosome segregation protein n=1 Tax=Encephalitozoon intestinalis (strain ATCC 50506) TaxID=876142 RepID=E0S5S2_ENCIT|nr:CAS/CSE chromosome segregation protein [Encephalitozoon intestinalis ATCC 50506]ADM11057.1 CAS/CSE chromosome segregation protein [Encephalitozoon intestinalis ATCC 50506]UTX44707.1 CSE chromosome segregation protein [Encephalitozoon intestinalis]
MEHLLNDILQNPQGPSVKHVEERLDGIDGQREFVELLKSGNGIAFTYMKTRCKEWTENPKRIEMIHRIHDVLFSLIFTSSEQNFGILCFFFETLYLCGNGWSSLVEDLCANPNGRSVRVLNHMFNKYRVCSRSNALYGEIIRNIELCQDIFRKAYFESLSEDENILGMFHSLVFQDIHPFFENNADRFLGSFCKLLRKQVLEKDVCEIFNLFVTKYPECVDMTRILGVVLTTITGFDYLKYTVLLNIVKRKSHPVLSKFSDALSNAVKMGAFVSENEIMEMNEDVLLYSRNLLKGYDVNRGIIIEMIGHLRKVFGEGWGSMLIEGTVATPIEEERLIFLCMALGIRLEEAVRKCSGIVQDSKSIGYLGVVSFRYLLSIGHYTVIDPGYINRGNPGSFLAMVYLSRCIDNSGALESLESYSTRYGEGNPEACRKIGGPENCAKIMSHLMKFLRDNIEDEFSSQLVQKVVRICPSSVSPEVVRFIDEFVWKNVRNINSPQAYGYLLDVQGLVFLKTGDNTWILNLVQVVLSEEIFEIYSSSLFLLAIVVLHSSGDFSPVVEIIRQESLWKTKELLLSMVCLTVSLFKTGNCSKEQVDYIVEYLLGVSIHHAYVLLTNTVVSGDYLKWIKGENIEEEFVLACALKKRGLISEEMYKEIYTRSLQYFEKNFVSKRNARRVLRGLGYGMESFGRSEAYGVMERNKHSIGYENIPFSVAVAFEL